MSVIIGVDPGKLGAIAVLEGWGPTVSPMPLIRSGKGRAEYDLPGILAIFRRYNLGVTAYVERGQPLPRSMGGASANYHRGYSCGLFEGMLSALGISYTLVSPQAWQRVMLAGTSGKDTKQRALIAAQRLFPGVSLLPTERCRKPSDGMADALLIAEYGRRSGAGEGAAGG